MANPFQKALEEVARREAEGVRGILPDALEVSETIVDLNGKRETRGPRPDGERGCPECGGADLTATTNHGRYHVFACGGCGCRWSYVFKVRKEVDDA